MQDFLQFWLFVPVIVHLSVQQFVQPLTHSLHWITKYASLHRGYDRDDHRAYGYALYVRVYDRVNACGRAYDRGREHLLFIARFFHQLFNRFDILKG